MLMKPYPVNHAGKIHLFKELHEAFTFCDLHRLPYPDRLYEPDGQPHARAMHVTGENIKKARAKQNKDWHENRQMELHGRYQ